MLIGRVRPSKAVGEEPWERRETMARGECVVEGGGWKNNREVEAGSQAGKWTKGKCPIGIVCGELGERI